MIFNFIHYGTNKFNKFYKYEEPIGNHPYYDKPIFCLYGSPLHSKHSWKWFMKYNYIKGKNMNKYFKFNVTGKFKIIRCAADLKHLPSMSGYNGNVIDWTKMAKKYDGIIFIISEHYKCSSKKLNKRYEFMVDSFDVDSIAVFNLNCVRL